MKRNAPVTEIQARNGEPLGMTPARFLREYWQKRPLLIRGALPAYANAITPEDLAGLACEDAALSRIVRYQPRHDRWNVRHGPFDESDFARLPRTNWTLLVQDVDKWDADVAAVLDEFAFLPAWRIDDVMVSYAVAGGGVGAHVDQYDVFLLQTRGVRCWRIDTDPGASRQLRGDVPLKLLSWFTPNHDWELHPGDMLYLPPGVPHEGLAVDECLTFSIGMRAPSRAEMLLDCAESLAEPLGEDDRYADPDLQTARDTHEIDAAALARVRNAMPEFAALDEPRLANWFGEFITRYRAAHEAAPPERAMKAESLRRQLAHCRLLRNPWTRMAWTRHGRTATLFAAGTAYGPCPPGFARLLAAETTIAGEHLERYAAGSALGVLLALVNAGHLRVRRNLARPAASR